MADGDIMFLLAPGPYEGSSQSVYDLHTDRVRWSADRRPELGRNLTLAEYREATGVDWRVVSHDDLLVLDAAYEATLITAPTPITRARYDEMLNVLPPCRWMRRRGIEIFHVSERVRGSIVAWFAHTSVGSFGCHDHAGVDADAIALKFAAAAAAFPPPLAGDERRLLRSLAHEDGSFYGSCAGRALDRLQALGLVDWPQPAQDCVAVTLTDAGRAVAAAFEAS